ncbi:MAG: methyltransferase domain-containing protein [Pseudomonadales bacterium]
MTDTDRDKWNDRYRDGAYLGRDHAAELVAEHAPDIAATQRAAAPSGSALAALDLACGAGRNARYLAGLGYRVDAVDIAAEALSRAAATPAEAPIRWIEHDLDLGLPRGLGDYDLILIIRYLDLSLVAAVAERLRPGGYLLCEAHLVSDAAVIGPRNPEFRARPGELRRAAAALDVAEYWEGVRSDPDGRAAALARLVAWRPYPRP